MRLERIVVSGAQTWILIGGLQLRSEEKFEMNGMWLFSIVPT